VQNNACAFISSADLRELSRLDIVSKSAEIMTDFVLAPFVLLVLLALPHMCPRNWLQRKSFKEVKWIDYFNIMFWNLNSWDCVSTLAGEVKDPAKMFPKAVLRSVQVVRFQQFHSVLPPLKPELNPKSAPQA
jgi:hypothetical protein